VSGETITSDLVLSGADYHTETLLDKESALTQKNIGTVEFLLLHLYCSMLVLIKKLKTYHIMLCFLTCIFMMQQEIKSPLVR
jgi:hypothetical protein